MTGTLTPEAVAALRDAAEWRVLSVLFERPAGARWKESRTELASACHDADIRRIAADAQHAREGTYLTALGPGGVVSPREIAHRQTSDPGHVLAQLSAYYDAFAYRPSVEEPPDHVAVETGFVAYLRMKEAFALAAGDDEHARAAREAADAFVAQHLSTFAEPLARKLGVEPDYYLARAADALLRRTGPRRPDVAGGWSPEGLGDSLECGGCGD